MTPVLHKLSIELISEEIEDPFGADANDLPIYTADSSDKPSSQQASDNLNTYELPPQLFAQWLLMQSNLTAAQTEIELLRQQIDTMRQTIATQDRLLEYLIEKSPPF